MKSRFAILTAFVVGFFGITLVSAGDTKKAGTGAEKQAVKEKRRLVLCNDGGTLGAPDMEAPTGRESDRMPTVVWRMK